MGEKFSFGTAMGEAVGVGRAAWGMTGAPLVTGVQRGLSDKLYRDNETRILGILSNLKSKFSKPKSG